MQRVVYRDGEREQLEAICKMSARARVSGWVVAEIVRTNKREYRDTKETNGSLGESLRWRVGKDAAIPRKRDVEKEVKNHKWR